jgi:hypothetical protein
MVGGGSCARCGGLDEQAAGTVAQLILGNHAANVTSMTRR